MNTKKEFNPLLKLELSTRLEKLICECTQLYDSNGKYLTISEIIKILENKITSLKRDLI